MSAPSGLLFVAVGLLLLTQGYAAVVDPSYNYTETVHTLVVGDAVVDVAMLSPGSLAVAASHSFQVYNVSHPPRAFILVGSAAAYNATRLTVSPDGRTAVITSSNGGLYVVDLQDLGLGGRLPALFHALPSAYDTAFQGGVLHVAQEGGVLSYIVGTRSLIPVSNLSGIGTITRLGAGRGDILWAGGQDGVYRLNVSVPTAVAVVSHILHRLRNYTEPLVFHDLDVTPDGEVACVSLAYPPSYGFDFKCLVYVDNSNPMGYLFHDGTLESYGALFVDYLIGGYKAFRTASGVAVYSATRTSFYTGVFEILPASLGQPRLNIRGPGGRVAVASSFNKVFIAAGADGLYMLTNHAPETPTPETSAPVTGTLTLAYSAAPSGVPSSRGETDAFDVFFWVAVALGLAVVGVASGTAAFCWGRRRRVGGPISRQEYSGVYNDAGDTGKENHELSTIMLVD